MTEILKERASTGCKVLRTRNHGRQLFSRRTQKVIYQIRYRHKFSRLVHVTGQEAFEFICIYMLRCKRRWYSANSPFRSMIGRVFLCTQTGRLRMQSNRSPVVNKKKNSKSSQPELSGRALCMELCDLWSCLETVKIMYTAQQRTHMDVRARRQRHGRR